MNYRELISALTPLHGSGEARAIVRMIMEERFGLSMTDLLLGKDTTLSLEKRAEFEKIAQRLLTGEPVQYVLGYADFCGHRFRVTPDVLIPRPETEELVQWSIQEMKTQADMKIVDFCTGSGCIATSLALAFPEAQVAGVDISEKALAIARENACTLDANNVTFIQQDILHLPSDIFSHSSISLLTANPPYVRVSEASDMSKTVLEHEPSIALFVPDDDPLLFYRAIANAGRNLLKSNGLILMELNTNLCEETRQLFAASGYTDIELRQDRYNRTRMLKVALPPL